MLLILLISIVNTKETKLVIELFRHGARTPTKGLKNVKIDDETLTFGSLT